MIDLDKKERDLLNRTGKKGKIFRQAETFTLNKGSNLNFILDPSVCHALIDKRALREVQNDDDAWVYMAETRLFAPNYVVDHNGSTI